MYSAGTDNLTCLHLASLWISFKSVGQAQQFLTAHRAVYNLFNMGRHLVRAQHYRNLRISAFNKWSKAVARDHRSTISSLT